MCASDLCASELTSCFVSGRPACCHKSRKLVLCKLDTVLAGLATGVAAVAAAHESLPAHCT
jgi:hypothetical protein